MRARIEKSRARHWPFRGSCPATVMGRNAVDMGFELFDLDSLCFLNAWLFAGDNHQDSDLTWGGGVGRGALRVVFTVGVFWRVLGGAGRVAAVGSRLRDAGHAFEGVDR